MNDAWRRIEGLLEAMRPLLIEAGIPEDKLQMPKGDTRRIRCGAPLEWILAIYQGPWQAADKIKKLLPPERWEYYKMQGFEDMREQILLAEKLTELRQAWKTNRPKFFGRKSNAKESSVSVETGDSEGAE